MSDAIPWRQWVKVLRNAADRLRLQDANVAIIFDEIANAMEEELGDPPKE